jgi:hypothetical protein
MYRLHRIIVTFIMFFTLVCPCGVYAASEQLSFSGVLLEKTNNIPVPVNQMVPMTCRIYDAPTGGIPLWSETQNVQVSNGTFNITLGQVSPIPPLLFERNALYIGVQIGIDPEMTPRQPLTSEGFTFNAKY